MSAPEITIWLADSCIAPGEFVEGRALIESGDRLGKIELSVLWYTAGEGLTDSGVVHFEVVSEKTNLSSFRHAFRIRVPLVPRSYEGKLIAIRWVVRVRAFVMFGRSVVVDQPFSVDAAPP